MPSIHCQFALCISMNHPTTYFALSEFCLNFETLSFCDDVHVLKGSPSGRLILTMHANSSFFEVVDYDKFWDKDKDKDKDDKLTQVDLIAIVTMFAQPSFFKGGNLKSGQELEQEREERDGLIILCLFFMELNRCGELHEKQT